MEIKIQANSSVRSVKSNFKKQTGCSLRVYNGARFAADDTKIKDLAKKSDFTGSLKLGARSRVGNVEDYFMNTFGIKVQVASADDKKLADNSSTLTQASKL